MSYFPQETVWARKDNRWHRVEIMALVNNGYIVRDADGEIWEVEEGDVKDREEYIKLATSSS